MSTFDPVGSPPVASILGSSVSGVNYQTTAAYIKMVGVIPTMTITVVPPRVTWFGLEVLHPGVSDARLTWSGVEVLRSVATGPTLAQVTWYGAEVLHAGVATARVTWFGLEVLANFFGVARITWFGVEVLRDYVLGGDNNGYVSIIW
jgi:hypothetical protein